MSRLQHFGWFFARGFGPQGWGRPYWEWNYDWRRPEVYAQSARELDQAGLDILVIEDAISLGTDETLDLRIRSAYGGPKHDPLLLTPYLFAATQNIGIAPTINAGATPPYLAARQAATLQHLSSDRFGMNVVTDVKSARHFGLEELPHDGAYDRGEEWISVVRRLWHSWGEGALVQDAAGNRYADASKVRPFRHEGEYFRVAGPLNAIPFENGDPTIVSPGGSPRGLGFAGANSDVQLALASLDAEKVRAYRASVHAAAIAQGRDPSDIKVLFAFTPEIVDSSEEADRVVAASLHPDDATLRSVLAKQSSDLETDLENLPLDRPIDPAVFGQHVSQGSIGSLLGGADLATTPLHEIATRKARKGRITDRQGWVGTADEIADFIEQQGADADNDGFLFWGDLHPVGVHQILDRLVPILRRRGILRSEFGGGGLRANLRDF
jgi:FMN-dependent oxidoreductase (nitrilotriacetate monooxygenase family)